MTDLALFPSVALVPTRTEIGSTATISADGQYRYDLTRRWQIGDDWMLFVMLNPSTADATADDPTIRRCIGFAKREGFGGMAVVNLFAYRATDPDDLRCAVKAWRDDPNFLRSVYPEGAENGEYIDRWVMRARTVVAAWGAGAPSTASRWRLHFQCRDSGKIPMCLGTTKHGHPRHPLYVKADAPLVEWKI